MRLAGPEGGVRHRTIEFGTPAPVVVTVTPRPRARRRYRTWPWIVGVALALLVVGAILLVMLLRGATVDGDVGHIGSGGAGDATTGAPARADVSPSGAGVADAREAR